MPKKPSEKQQKSSPPWLKWAVIGGIALVVITITSVMVMNQTPSSVKTLPSEISVDDAYEMYNEGAFLLDVRTQEEWDEYHAPGTTLIPLDELPDRLAEVPTDQTIVVVCRSGNRSQQGRDILLDAGYEQVTSMADGLKTWRTLGYPVSTGP
jgi:rhodanese-related sulfurtransferase